MATRISANPPMPAIVPSSQPPLGHMVSMMNPMLSQMNPIPQMGNPPPAHMGMGYDQLNRG